MCRMNGLLCPLVHARRWRRLAALGALWLAGCASPPPGTHATASAAARIAALLPADVLLIGEQHDADAHQQLEQAAVATLAARGQLAALVMEMAEAGHSTAGLPRDADAAAVRQALAWNEAGWPWARYGPVALAAVRAGVPVLGGNLPRAEMRAAMREPAWDAHLPPAALQRQFAALREGHCHLLPEAQIPAMARIQIARDARMAATVATQAAPGRVVVLVAGSGHVLRSLGVPTHLPAHLQSKVLVAQARSAQDAMDSEADAVIVTAPLPPHDACAALRAPPPGPASSPAPPESAAAP